MYVAQPKIGMIPSKTAVFSWDIYPGQLIAEDNHQSRETAVNLGPHEEYAANTTLPKSFALRWFPP